MTARIGYYVHHVGQGHLRRAEVLAARLSRDGVVVTGLSSLERPPHWDGDWVVLPRDDDGDPRDVTAHGHLHWAPLLHDGTRSRAATISSWIESARPELVVVDVSVEVLLLARLHGVPTIAVVLPGQRDDDAHLLGLGTSETLVAFWPVGAHGMSPGLPPALAQRLVPVGALSRHPVREPAARRTGAGPRSVALMLGSGGHQITAADVAAARGATPGWQWHVLGADAQTWVADPSPTLDRADVVVTHAGQNAIAETAAARRPAVVLPQVRPHREQLVTADVLAGDWPAVVCRTWPTDDWPAVLDRASSLDAGGWARWCDGGAADRFADVVLETRRRLRGRSG